MRDNKPYSYVVPVTYINGMELHILDKVQTSSLYDLRKSAEIELFKRITDHKVLNAYIHNMHFHACSQNVDVSQVPSDLLTGLKKAIEYELLNRNIEPRFSVERAEKADLNRKVIDSQLVLL